MATLQGQGTASAASAPSPAAPTAPEPTELISKHKMSELLRHSSSHRMEPEVEEVLLELADDFLENLISAGSVLAKHRGSDVLEVRDVALHMERAWDMRLPGYSHHLESLDMRGKRQGLSEIHKKRLALIRKTNELTEKEEKKKSTAAKRKRKEGEAP